MSNKSILKCKLKTNNLHNKQKKKKQPPLKKQPKKTPTQITKTNARSYLDPKLGRGGEESSVPFIKNQSETSIVKQLY